MKKTSAAVPFSARYVSVRTDLTGKEKIKIETPCRDTETAYPNKKTARFNKGIACYGNKRAYRDRVTRYRNKKTVRRDKPGLNKKNERTYLLKKAAAAVILCVATAFLLNPQTCAAAVYDGFKLFVLKVFPSLFPFLVLGRLFIAAGGFDGASDLIGKIFRKLYNTPAASGYVFLTALLSGYPVGAKLTADMYKNGFLSAEQAKTSAAFSSVCGPLFALGFVGGLLQNASEAGAVILICHYLSALASGFFFRTKKNENADAENAARGGFASADFYNKTVSNNASASVNFGNKKNLSNNVAVVKKFCNQTVSGNAPASANFDNKGDLSDIFKPEKLDHKNPSNSVFATESAENPNDNEDFLRGADARKTPQNLLAETVTSALSASLLVGGFIALFNMLCEIISAGKPFALAADFLTVFTKNDAAARGILLALIEMTRGISAIAAAGIPYGFSIPIVCALISFGGLSVTLQSLAFLKPAGISAFCFIKMKLTQSLFAAIFASLASIILNITG
ncbi:MAG: hypothetical protein LBP79_05275 [Clostridiales bacterium]|jgi:hypothetical protein|nr:hypothetical protein [Clostridiales bacterium]